jgi:nucleoside-triphosphatase THEP1
MQQIPFKPLQSVWLKAAVAGSLWASIEIIAGSFLHNLSFPLSGTVLSFTGVYLLVSFSRIWKEKGLIWRAGLICALMKSISPSAIILGPMIGILTEAMLLELSLRLIGRNLAGSMTGGALAVFSTLVQKLVSLLIMYGFDFVRILAALYKFSLKQIHATPVNPLYLVLIIAGIYLASGMIAGFLGFRSGNRYMKKRSFMQDPQDITFQPAGHSFAEVPGQHYSIVLLVMNVCAVVLCLTLLNYRFELPVILLCCVYLAFCFYRYRSSLRRLAKISLWIQFLLLTLAAAFLWNGISTQNYFTLDGLIIGLKMIFRAVIVITGFTAVSIEMKNPVVRSISYEKGMASLYQSLGLSFAALPGILSSMAKPKGIKKHSHFSVSLLLKRAESLLQQFEQEHSSRPPVIIVTGEIGEGKTTFVAKVITGLKEKGYKIGGFLATGIHEDDKRTGFDLMEIPSSRRIELCRVVSERDWIPSGHYFFNPRGMEEGNKMLDYGHLSGMHLVVIDEVGPMEMNDGGWGKSIRQLCRSGSLPQLWVVRKGLVEKAARKWNVGTVYVFDVVRDPVEEVIRKAEELSGMPLIPSSS